MKREEYGGNNNKNIEEKIFVIFEIISKIKVKRKENLWLLTTNSSTNMLTS